jgi:hypothetical protein
MPRCPSVVGPNFDPARPIPDPSVGPASDRAATPRSAAPDECRLPPGRRGDRRRRRSSGPCTSMRGRTGSRRWQNSGCVRPQPRHSRRRPALSTACEDRLAIRCSPAEVRWRNHRRWPPGFKDGLGRSHTPSSPPVSTRASMSIASEFRPKSMMPGPRADPAGQPDPPRLDPISGRGVPSRSGSRSPIPPGMVRSPSHDGGPGARVPGPPSRHLPPSRRTRSGDRAREPPRRRRGRPRRPRSPRLR